MKLHYYSLISLFAFSVALSAHDKGNGMGHFKEMDANSDKKITKEEWQTFHDARFTEFDKDADGSITADEIKNFKKVKKEEKRESKKEEKNGKK